MVGKPELARSGEREDGGPWESDRGGAGPGPSAERSPGRGIVRSRELTMGEVMETIEVHASGRRILPRRASC